MTKRLYQHMALFRGPYRMVVRVAAGTPSEAAETLAMFLRDDVNIGSAETIDRDHEISLQADAATLEQRAFEARRALEAFRAMMKEERE
jgi:hypothetical protein